LEERKTEFIRLMIESQALLFGSYTLKSGRVSPYFFNAARFQTANQLIRLGEFYGGAIQEAAPKATIVFGPAYKGIPLCIGAAMALAKQSGREVGYLFNRKEEKTHGDRGRFVGQTPAPDDRLVIVDDVITDGETKREAVALLQSSFQAPIDALVIAFDRMEKGPNGENALADFATATGIPVVPILTLAELQTAMEESSELVQAPPGALDSIQAYRDTYGLS